MNRLAVEKGVESGVYQDKTTQPGDYKFVDLNGDGQITDADRTVIGNGYPKFTYGMNLTASWKNFDFSMNLYGVAGMDILSYSSARLTSVYAPDGGYQNVLKEYINNAWSSSNTGAKYPRITKTDIIRTCVCPTLHPEGGLSEDFKYSDRIYIPEECAETGENGKCTRICQCRQCMYHLFVQ